MKYPLKVVTVVEHEWTVAVADADGKIICHVLDKDWGNTFAHFVVRAANRWHSFRPWFRKYDRNAWLAERGVKVMPGRPRRNAITGRVGEVSEAACNGTLNKPPARGYGTHP